MSKSSKPEKKKRVRRKMPVARAPASPTFDGHLVQVCVHLPADMVEKVDARAKASCIRRAQVLRALIAAGLQAKGLVGGAP